MEHVPFVVYESALARAERTNKRLWILSIILITILLVTNMGWIYYESQWEVYETQSVDQEIDTGSGSATVIGIGDYNGENKTDDQNN